MIGTEFGEYSCSISELKFIVCADPTFVDWLFEEAAKGAPDAAPPAPEASTSTQRRESPPHLAETVRKPPSGPRAGAPLYQQAISQGRMTGLVEHVTDDGPLLRLPPGSRLICFQCSRYLWDVCRPYKQSPRS